MSEIALVAALEREVWPLVRSWRLVDREYGGRCFRFFEAANRVAVCGGMGAEAARRATEAVIMLYQPAVVQSVGFAGALDNGLRIGQVLEPRYIVDASDGSRVDTGSGIGTLVSFASVAGKAQKARLATAYGAQAVDMEAAAVARGTQAHGLRFAAVKVVSDDLGLPVPDMERFTDRDGRLREWAFAVHAALRPWLWFTVICLGRNSSKASHALSQHLKSAEHAHTGSASIDAAPLTRNGP